MLGFVKKRHVSITIIVLLVVLTFTRFNNPLFLPLLIALLAVIAYAILRTIFRMRKRRPVIAAILGLVFIWVIILEFQNFTGFCRAEWKYLTDEELIQRAAGKIYEDNPYCCEVSDSYIFSDAINDFINRIFGRYHYGLEMYKKEKSVVYGNTYRQKYKAVNQCGKVIDTTGMERDAEAYNEFVNKIKQQKECQAPIMWSSFRLVF